MQAERSCFRQIFLQHKFKMLHTPEFLKKALDERKPYKNKETYNFCCNENSQRSEILSLLMQNLCVNMKMFSKNFRVHPGKGTSFI